MMVVASVWNLLVLFATLFKIYILELDFNHNIITTSVNILKNGGKHVEF